MNTECLPSPLLSLADLRQVRFCAEHKPIQAKKGMRLCAGAQRLLSDPVTWAFARANAGSWSEIALRLPVSGSPNGRSAPGLPPSGKILVSLRIPHPDPYAGGGPKICACCGASTGDAGLDRRWKRARPSIPTRIRCFGRRMRSRETAARNRSARSFGRATSTARTTFGADRLCGDPSNNGWHGPHS